MTELMILPATAPATLAEQITPHLIRPAVDSDAPRVLLLHGLASSRLVWQALANEVSTDCALWTVELPWHAGGGTSWSQRSEVGSWAGRAMDAVPGGVDVVIAHSFSANVVLSHLDRVGVRSTSLRGLVLVSPFYRDNADEFDWETISYYLNGFHRILAEGIRVRSAGRLDPERQRDMALRVQDRVGPYGWIRFFETYLGTPHLRLDRISLPCLVVGGEQDFAAFPSDADTLARALPDGRAHILPDCGHFPMIERAEAFGALVSDFLVDFTQHWSQTR